MFNLPKVKKTLAGLVSAKRLKKVVASAAIAGALFVAAISTDASAAMSTSKGIDSPSSNLQIGALLLAPETEEYGKVAAHYSHSSHSSHASHASHHSHYSSTY